MEPKEIDKVASGMIWHGGYFERHLGKALMHADPENAQKIKETWPNFWGKYQ